MRKAPPSFGIGLVLAGALASPLGCTETPAPVAPPTPTASVAAEPPPPPAPELTPVPEPPGIFATARWKNPNATLGGLGSCAGVPADFAETNARRLLDRALANAFRGGVDGKEIAEAIALDAPVDLVLALEDRRGGPSALFAFSVGLVSLDRVKSALSSAGPLEEVQPNLWRVGVKSAGDLTCVVGPAAGAAPARLICGQRDKDVAVLGPYLARNLPVAAPPAQDVHAEIRFTPIDERYGAQLRSFLGVLPNLARLQLGIGEPRFDGALTDAATALADEGAALSADLDRVTLDLGVDSASCLTASAAVALRGKKSWIAGLIAERGDASGPPPAIFWRAPVDSDTASYGRATDVARYDGIFRTLRALVEGKLAKEQVGTEADRKALAALLALPVGKSTNVVVAGGHWSVAPPPPSAGNQISVDLSRAGIWYMLGFDEGPAALSKLLKDAVNVYGRKALNERLQVLSERLGKQLGEPQRLPTAKFVPAPAQLGRGALDLELRFDSAPLGVKPDPKDKKTPGMVWHVLLMGEAQSTWIAVGLNREELVKRLLAVKAGAPEGGTLAARPGLEPLRSGKAVSSAFVTLGMFTRDVGVSGPQLAFLENLPHKGETPIFLTSTAASAGPRTELTINMQKGSLEDLGAIILKIRGPHP